MIVDPWGEVLACVPEGEGLALATLEPRPLGSRAQGPALFAASAPVSPSAGELLGLDALTLREADGGMLDLAAQALRIEESLHCAQALGVWRTSQLVAYALLQPQESKRAFVRGFCLHPGWRQAGVLLDLLRAVQAWVTEHGVRELHSHVRNGNAESLALHRQLGFEVLAENELAYAFVARAEALGQHPVLRRAGQGSRS